MITPSDTSLKYRYKKSEKTYYFFQFTSCVTYVKASKNKLKFGEKIFMKVYKKSPNIS